MTPNRTRTGLFETPRGQPKSEPGFGGRPLEPPKTKISQATPKLKRVVKSTSKAEPGSLPHTQSARSSADHSTGSVASADRSPRSVTPLDRSPKSADSKIHHFFSKANSASDRQSRAVKKSDLQAELNALKEELKAANEHLVYLEKEKSQALEELESAKRHSDEAYEQLTMAIAAKKEAEEKIEIEKFKIVELEQAGIEAAQQREEAWQKEIGDIRNQHAVDVSSLLTATKELERLKHELAMTTEAKNAATAHADDALKIAEIHAEKVGLLSTEVNRLKGLLDSKLENAAKETAEHARRLEVDIDTLRDELRRTREAEKKKNELEILVKDLKGEIADAKKEKSKAEASVIEWKKKAELLEVKAEEAAKSEKLAKEALAKAEKHLEDSTALLEEAKSEIACLKGKVESLEMEVEMLKDSLNQSNSHLKAERNESLEMETMISSLKSKIKSMEEEQQQALEHVKEMASNIPVLEEERNELVHELEDSKDKVEKVQKAMDGLNSALQEADAEAKESKKELEMKESEVSDALCQLDELKKALKSTEERYKALLSEAQNEVATLKHALEGSGMEAKDIMSERNIKEDNYMSSIQKAEEEVAEIKQEMDRLVSKLKGSEEEAAAAKEEGAQLLNRLEQVMLDAKSANEVADMARADGMQLKERLLDKENALQCIAQENEELRAREEEANKKILELSAMLEAVMLKEKENGVLSKSEVDHIVVSKVTESTGEAEVMDDANKSELHLGKYEDLPVEEQSLGELIGGDNRKQSNAEREDKNEENNDYTTKKAPSPEKDTEPAPFTAKQYSRTESLDPKFEEMSPNREHPEKKKKFLSKFFKKKSLQK